MQKTILVTGGSGFLGSFLCEKLLELGHIVINVDNYHTGRKSNISHLIKNPNFEVIRHNVCEPISLEVDQIFNLACPASPVHYQSQPIETIKTNVNGTINILDLATKTNAKVFQASTSEVYGDPIVHPQVEDYWGNVNPIGIRSCYDEGKRCAETLCFDYQRQYGLVIKVGRIFNTYGPRMSPNDGRVVSNFIVQALQNKPITMFGDGSQTRSFCYVSDLIDAFVKFMDTDDSVTGPINLGNPDEFTVLELAQKVIELTNSKSKIEFLPLPADDPVRRKPNIEKAKATLNWEPKVKLNQGLIKTIDYFSKLATE